MAASHANVERERILGTMSPFALALVLIAAVLHPTWNVLAKRATEGDPIAFIWLTTALSAALYVPVVVTLVLVTHEGLRDAWLALAMMAGSSVLHVIYFVLLQRSYRVADFSFVYPLARGLGPLATAVVAIAFFGERLAVVQCAGVGIIVVAIFVIAGGHAERFSAAGALRRSLLYGIGTGLAIACYTLWDKQAVYRFAIAPILYDAGRIMCQLLVLTPSIAASSRRLTALAATWKHYRREALGVSVLSPLAYVLVLYALTTSPVSLVAPARESSIIIGAFMGARILGEAQWRRRLIAASLMFVGIVALARG